MKENLDTLDKIMRDVKLRDCRFLPSVNFQKHLSFTPPEAHLTIALNNGSLRGTLGQIPKNDYSIMDGHGDDPNFRGESFEDNGTSLPSSIGNNMRFCLKDV